MSKVKLRPLGISDLDNVMTWVNNPEVIRNFSKFDHKITREEEAGYIESLLRSNNDKAFSIEDNYGNYIGQAGINQIFWPAKLGRLTIIIGNKEYQGKGLGQEVIQELLRIGFEDLKLHKIWGVCFKENERMNHILSKLGFVKEGILRSEYFLKDRYHDIIRYSILDSEYFESKRGVSK